MQSADADSAPKQPKAPRKNRTAKKFTHSNEQGDPQKQHFFPKLRKNKSLTHTEDSTISATSEEEEITLRTTEPKRKKIHLSLRRKRKSGNPQKNPTKDNFSKWKIKSPRRSKPKNSLKQEQRQGSPLRSDETPRGTERSCDSEEFEPDTPSSKNIFTQAKQQISLPVEDIKTTVKQSPRMKFMRRSLTHRDNNQSDLTTAENFIVTAQAFYQEGKYPQAQKKLKHAILELDLLAETKALNPPLRFSLACAYFFRGECFLKEGLHAKAERHARYSLDILDQLLFDNVKIVKSKPSQGFTESNWIPGQSLTIEAIWLRRSSVEELIGKSLSTAKAHNYAAIEWLQRADFSRKRARAPVNPSISIFKTKIIIEQVLKYIQNAELFIQSGKKEIASKLLSDLKGIPLLNLTGQELRKAIRQSKNENSMILESYCALENTLEALIKLGNLEISLNLEKPDVLSGLEDKLKKVRKSIEKLNGNANSGLRANTAVRKLSLSDSYILATSL